MCGWQPAFGRWPQRCVEQPKRMEVKLKVLGGRIWKYKGMLRRRMLYRCMYHGRSMDNTEYKVEKKTAKRVVSVAKGRDTRIFTNVWVQKERTYIWWLGYFNQVKCIKNEKKHLLMKDEARQMARVFWQIVQSIEWGHNLSVGYLDDSFDNTNRRLVRRIKEELNAWVPP
jgi:hypothetical protein